MSEFDLVPSEYRKNRKIKANIKLFLWLYALVIIAIIVAKVMVDNKVNIVKKQEQQQQSDKDLIVEQQRRYDELHQNITVLERRVEVLDSLREGPTAISVFKMLDRVLSQDVWVTSWQFSRSNEWTEPEPESESRGYLIVISQENGQQKEQAWRLNAHLSLKGQAIDHSSLATFVSALLHQPEIKDVLVQKTILREYMSGSVIDYSLAIILNNKVQVVP